MLSLRGGQALRLHGGQWPVGIVGGGNSAVEEALALKAELEQLATLFKAVLDAWPRKEPEVAPLL